MHVELEFYYPLVVLASVGLCHLTVKPLMDILEYTTFGFLFENGAIPEKYKDKKSFKVLRYIINLISGVRL